MSWHPSDTRMKAYKHQLEEAIRDIRDPKNNGEIGPASADDLKTLQEVQKMQETLEEHVNAALAERKGMHPAEAYLYVWDKLPGESPEMFESFVRYRDTGGSRSIQAVHRSLLEKYKQSKERQAQGEDVVVPSKPPTPTTLAKWAKLFAWAKRAQAWDAESDRLTQIWHLEKRRNAIKRQAGAASLLIDKAIRAAANLKPEELKPQQIPTFLKVAADIEQAIYGVGRAGGVIDANITQTSTNTNVTATLDTSDLTPQEAALRLRQLQAEIAQRLDNGDPLGAQSALDVSHTSASSASAYHDKHKAGDPNYRAR
nr:MAG TPA: hypothetical protein [Caudoviricetes sp.]